MSMFPPGDGHPDNFVRIVERLVDRKLDRHAPRMGTVHDVDGDDNPIVRLWDDDDDGGTPARVGRARKAGTRFAKNDRVILQPVLGGDFVVMGKVASTKGDDQVIGPDQIADEAVNDRKLASGAVKSKHISADLKVGAENIRDGSIDLARLTPDVSARVSEAASRNEVNAALAPISLSLSGVQNTLRTLPNWSAYATHAEVQAVADTVTALSEKVDRLQERVQNLADKIKK